MILSGRRVVLGVSGGIASYKACTIARRLTEAGASVDAVLTASACEFVRPLTFEALTHRPVLTSLWEPGHALAHIDVASHADLMLIAPATANLMARVRQGIADDLLSAMVLAATCPIVAAPAMNDAMYAHPATQQNIAALRERGWTMVGPAVGPLAEGPSDRPGRMVEPEEIVSHAIRAIRSRSSRLAGKRLLVTAGPTRESLDTVRTISNPSSGRMGYAIAAAGFERGAQVDLVSGPTVLEPPPGVRCVAVTSTADMLAAVRQRLGSCDVLIMAAAPADFAPRTAVAGKRPRSDGDLTIELMPTPDILVETRAERNGVRSVGFALEAGPNVERARTKLRDKGLDLIVLNRADEAGSGFETMTNRVTLISSSSTLELEQMPKTGVAERILDAVEALL